MDILLIGSGGREHAICRGLRKSKQVETIYCAPGNPGMAQIAECVALPSDNESIADFAEKKKVGLVVIGPEAPLCQGVADAVRARGIPVFGPSGAAARLEGSKEFSKAFMVRYGIPTAAYAAFADREAAEAYVRSEYAAGRGVVVKADGLAAGKGVIVASSLEEALDGVRECFSGGSSTPSNSGKISVIFSPCLPSPLLFHTITPLRRTCNRKRVDFIRAGARRR